MSTLFNIGTESAPEHAVDAEVVQSGDRIATPVRRRVDSNAVRWVFAATVAFWLVVYAAGSRLF